MNDFVVLHTGIYNLYFIKHLNSSVTFTNEIHKNCYPMNLQYNESGYTTQIVEKTGQDIVGDIVQLKHLR